MVFKSKKSIISRIFFNPKTLALIGLIIIILISIPLAKNVSQRYKINQEIKDLQKEIADLENNNIDLKKFASYLESDQFVEEQARLNLGLKKEGESVIVIKGEEGKNDNSSSATSSIFNIPGLNKEIAVKPVTNVQRWVKYFFR